FACAGAPVSCPWFAVAGGVPLPGTGTDGGPFPSPAKAALGPPAIAAAQKAAASNRLLLMSLPFLAGRLPGAVGEGYYPSRHGVNRGLMCNPARTRAQVFTVTARGLM